MALNIQAGKSRSSSRCGCCWRRVIGHCRRPAHLEIISRQAFNSDPEVCLCLFGRAHATHTKVRRGELFFLALITSSKLQPRTGMAKCSCKQLHVTNAFFSAAAEAFGGPSANIGKVTPHAIATNSDLWHSQTPLPATSCNTPQARLRREPHEDVTL